MIRSSTALLLLALALPASADIWLCVGANDKQSIQDKPCGKGKRTKSHVPDAPRRANGATGPRAAAGGASGSTAGSKTPIEVGLKKNKAVICKLLDSEKADALAQIGGTLAAPPGEDPKDNLAKIEKQRTRVGCDVS